jgi:fumarate reductase subunit C
MTTEARRWRRPTAGWWNRNAFYRWYMLREVSCVFVIAYALVLLAGVAALANGKEAYTAWRLWLGSPLALTLHIFTLVFMVYHSWTWFKVMPKTLPFVRLGDKRVSDRAIVTSGVVVAVLTTVVLYALVFGVTK